MSIWADGVWAPGFWAADLWVGLGADTGTSITNTSATQPTGNSYSVCQLSGYRAKPGELTQRWDGLWVLPRFSESRSEQDFIRVHAEKLEGSIRPESEDTFISADLDPDTDFP